jgi:hypothetical protein
MAKDPEFLAHLQWIGYVQPVGLVVSPPALIAAQAFPAKNIIPDHTRFLEVVEQVSVEGMDEPQPAIRDFPRLAAHVLGWEPADLIGADSGSSLPDALEVTLPEYNETLRPSYAVPEFEKDTSTDSNWLMLIQRVKLGLDLDETPETDSKDHRWQASPHARFERLLRETQVPIGLLSNGTHLRLVYAPRGETSGNLTFPVQAMTEVAGRPIFAAFHMLLNGPRVFNMPDKQRLPAMLAESRKYQSQVSTKLAQQVLAALYELLRGFQAADDQRHGELLRDELKDDPNQVYAGLITVLLRMVFLLYAEDRSLLSTDEVYQKFYSVAGLFERLREDAGRYTDTMDHRFGAWAQLLTLFRLVYDGARHGGMELPARRGYLFDPDRYPFLEGRPMSSRREPGERTDVPRVSDGVIFRVLQNLLILDGERLSYRTLDVEQIGSVYETMMGFNLEIAQGRSVAINPTKPHGAPTTINLDELLAVKPTDRAKWLRERSDQIVTAQAATALKDAKTHEDAVASVEKRIAREATPNIVPPGAMVLQPSEERRRSGLHYTPRSLTEPIVRTTLRPILQRLGTNPRPEQILDLKLCDPAMGSGAFLVEACRQLAQALLKSWAAHPDPSREKPPAEETPETHAERLIARRCLFGVDKNPMAVDLSKLSLWLATLAKGHPFTFLDHALRCGDSLVGLDRKQLTGVHWAPTQQVHFVSTKIALLLLEADRLRRSIEEAPEKSDYEEQQRRLEDAEAFQDDARLIGDAVVSAFFQGGNPKEREKHRAAGESQVMSWLAGSGGREPLEQAATRLEHLSKPVHPFHWLVEFPEVFSRTNPGFDGIVGNPPFAGKNTLAAGHAAGYPDWLKEIHEESHGNSDLVAHFFRRAFNLLRQEGAFGLIATNTIGQGDTRSTGLRWICKHGGTLYDATRRTKWPGLAAVTVSVVHVHRGLLGGPFQLDGRIVPRITAYLFHAGGHDDPAKLKANAGKSFQGSIVLGMGFTFDDTDQKGIASSLADMNRLIAKDPRNAERINPYIGGEEVNDSPTHAHHRYVINFGDMTEEEARRWPDIMRIVEEKVKPVRLEDNRASYRKYWWQYAEKRGELYEAIEGLDRVIFHAYVSKYMQFAFLPKGLVYAGPHYVFVYDRFSAFDLLQSRPHEIWALFFSATFEDRVRYTPSDCLETFPFPESYLSIANLESAGRKYYEFRADLMIRNREGLTKTYNRFHDPDERSPDILQLRQLHAEMDRSVLDAYGWTDLKSTCEFVLDYEEDEDQDDTGGGRRRKKPWRYRWPDDFRDEVLARLLELNRQRAEEERLSGEAAEGKRKKPKKTSRKVPHEDQGGLF